MIGWLRGTVRLRDPRTGFVVVDVGGVGYQVLVSMQTLAAVGEEGEGCELWIHTHVREDALELFGFASVHERRAFQLLLSVPQVGPRLANTITGGFPLAELLAAIADGEIGKLTKIPGVGKKTAERVVMDLRDKVPVVLDALGERAEKRAAEVSLDLRDEARAVLVGLGWKGKQVEAALDEVLAGSEGEHALDEIVRRALAALMKR